jgi:D-psicose/D-tagatose/L-ribulose 3-epimerase
LGFKYSVVAETLSFIGYDVLDNPRAILQAVKDAGYDAIDLPGNPWRVDGKAIRQVTDAVGLAVPEMLGAWAYFHAGEDRNLSGPDEVPRRRGIEYAKKAIDLVVEVGAHFFEICAPQPPVPELPFAKEPIEVLRGRFIAAMKEICAYATERGIAILLEPLNPYEAIPGILTSIYDAISVIEDLRPYDVGIQPDIFHMNISDPAIPDTLRAAGKYIRHIHANETTHGPLGTGHADYRAILQALLDSHYTGYLAVYMPYTTQAAARSVAHGYGHADVTAGPATRDLSDLRFHLARTIGYLKNLEQSLIL